MSAPALVFSQVTKDYRLSGGGPRVRALDALSLSIPTGGIFGLLGPNGSGKSTALKVALGLVRGDAGSCQVAGASAGSAEARAMMGYLPEQGGVHLHLSGWEALMSHARLQGWNRRGAADRAAALLQWVDLTGAAERRVESYSRGMRQRLAFAQALVPDPAVLILDEPFSGVDPLATRRLLALLEALRAEGKTIVLSSHLLDGVGRGCDAVAMLHRGKVIAEGTVAEVLGPAPSISRGFEDVFIERVAAAAEGGGGS
ncbi:ABC transporter ATP-binding protein [Synoicihabitans lomoniglobus]|uniref:ABC transporter ATP-binding protein n=1 Tax=Synoicihabitans lomoniglobus TaxID=2909285 RepID=A0AAF0CSF2_9BACT|nr:ABC transporter ATP-binding protein [Opitutaceae bacterium LMO-M01]WED67192.1 ABC transporter ATP-binding protein [Opitutaceae bacterium LMO-M01]